MLIEKADSGKYAMFCIPGLVRTEEGTLLACYECRKSKSDWAEIDIKVIRSTDEGNSWQTVTVIEGEGHTLNNPVLIVKGNEVHFLFLKDYKVLHHCVSTDDGKTFSVPQRKELNCDFFFNAAAVGPGHGTVHNGNMIVPIWFAQNREDPKEHRPSILSTLWSVDGDSWHPGENIGRDVLRNPSECALAVTAEGDVLISIRNENDCRLRAFAQSATGFSGWSTPAFHPQFPDPICMGSMCYENGTVYHINCESSVARENLTVKASGDGFRTVERIFVDTPAGYADLAVHGGTLYVFYEKDCLNDGLYFKKITR